MEGQDFFEYLELQGSPEMVTKSELLDHVRRSGGRISDRQLTFYASEGLVPKSVRVGSRAGAYPKVVQELVVWIVSARARGLSVEALKEVVPVWRAVVGGRKKHEIDLGLIEQIARKHVRSPEAVFAVPSIFAECLDSICEACQKKVVFRLKDGTEVFHTQAKPLVLGFVAATQDEESGEARPVASMQIVLPTMPDPATNPATIVLGIPNGVELPARLPMSLNENCDQEDAAGEDHSKGRSVHGDADRRSETAEPTGASAA